MFVHQILTWGFLLALVPLLIHLINMMRHQRVKWAAMDFLLQSYKKHRKWIWLKQLLLLLMRMAAIALLVAMLAQWVTRNQWFDLFSGRTTHHFVLLDDSYSMADRAGATTAFDTAKQVIGRLVQHAGQSDEFGQKLTLIRYSQAARGVDASTEAAAKIEQVADFNEELIDSQFDQTLEEKRNQFDITQLAVTPNDAVSLVRQLLEKGTRDRNVVYLVSDFRANQWENPAELRESLRAIEKTGAEVHLVNCVKQTQSNLAITEIRTGEDTRAAGVPLFVYVTVKNYGSQAVKRVQLKTRTIYFPPELTAAGDADNAAGQVEDLPTQLIEEIKPGESATTRVQVFFPKPGQHAVEASLPDDAVATDNRRWCIVDCPEGEPVLVIDGSADQRPSYFLSAVFQPGDRANTGIRPNIQRPAYLRDVTSRELNAYRAIYLLDVDRLDERAVKNLEEYVSAGGGLAVFVGDRVNFASYNQTLYRNGEGLMPLPLERIDVLPPKVGATPSADIEVTDHPVFKVFLGETNSFIRLVTIERHARPPVDWKVPEGSTVEIAARLRNREPLVVEKKFGEGKVLAFLTTLDPDWNNWAGDPSFIITQLKLQSYLASTKRPDESSLVGTPISLSLEAEKFQPSIKFVTPGAKLGTRVVIDRAALRPKENSPVLQASLGKSVAASSSSETSSEGETDRAGVYEAWSTTVANTFETRRFAVNVENSEGDLTIVDAQQLAAKLAPVKAKIHDADAFDWELGNQGGFNRSLLVMALLVLLLLGEQLLAYSASYHPPQVHSAAPAIRAGRDWKSEPYLSWSRRLR